MSGVTCHMSGAWCQVSRPACCMPPVTCHLSLIPTATATDHPVVTPPLWTVGWCATTKKKRKKIQKAKNQRKGKTLKCMEVC